MFPSHHHPQLLLHQAEGKLSNGISTLLVYYSGFSRETEPVRGACVCACVYSSSDLQGESASWRPRKDYGGVLVQRPAGLRPRKSQCPSSKSAWQEEFSFGQGMVSLFALFRPSTDWMKPTQSREDNLLYSVYRLKC